jgi:hypothetical protein
LLRIFVCAEKMKSKINIKIFIFMLPHLLKEKSPPQKGIKKRASLGSETY